ncbi:MAG: hypothetical protein AB8F95_08550 [Bacteroidia bacterium]
MLPIIWIVLALLIAPLGRGRKIGMGGAFLVSLLLSPIIGLFVVMNSGLKHPRGCIHCGNVENEAVFCGICGKNDAGQTREEAEVAT